jgi:hypothetical protein
MGLLTIRKISFAISNIDTATCMNDNPMSLGKKKKGRGYG